VLPLTQEALKVSGLHFMRDPTRGGLATVAHELQRATNMGISLSQPDIPVRDPVQSVCDMLGYDPMYLACEGRVVAVVAADDAEQLLQRWQALPQGNAAGKHVLLQTELGGERILEELEDDPLPRIC